MTNGFMMDKSFKTSSVDYTLISMFVLIAGLGLASLYSASYGYAVSLGKEASYFVSRQLVWYIFAIVIFFICSVISLDFIKRLMPIIVLGSLFLLVLPFVPGIGIEKNGASRWIGFSSLSFQPSELFKPVLVLYMAYILSKKTERISDVVHAILPPLFVIIVGVAIILLQTDFSTAMLLVILAVVMLWIANVPMVFFIALATIGLPGIALLILTSEYRLKRVLGFIAPNFDPSDISYQINGSIQAIRSGGLLGKGLGQGTLKIRSIPEVQSDFVFASLVEESGFVGVLLFFALWGFAMYRCFKIAIHTADKFKSFLCFGLTSYLCIQILFNVMVVAGVVPATGIPLPFFSSGGSSLLSVSIATGLILNVSRYADYSKESVTMALSEENSSIENGVY